MEISSYEPQNSKSASMTPQEKIRVEFIRKRVQLMADSKSTIESKWRLIKQLYEVYEKHLTEGENWNASYRFGELFGAVQRKFSDLLDNMPEVRVSANKSSAQNFAIAQQATLDHTERTGNSIREKGRVIFDSVLYGTGVNFEGYTKVERMIAPVKNDLSVKREKMVLTTLYDGLCTERVDVRDFFVDETANIFYDETGVTGARDCARRRVYPWSTFQDKFKEFKHADSVVPMSWGEDALAFGKTPYDKETYMTSSRYVSVIEYWNVELDMVCLVANGVEIYYGANPFKHKRLPFVLYYNYRRDDSVWGVSEAELLAPFIFAQEEIENLMILDMKLALQPALAISGDVMFNTEENELQPGAIMTLRGLNGGKVGDAITPLRFGGLPDGSMELLQKLDDSRIVVTGDDIKALYENPNQLATQTLSKREVAQKRLRSNIMQNTIDSERNRVTMRLSNIIQFYACPYQTIDGRVEFRRIKVSGYEVLQNDDESPAEFVQAYGAQNYFTLNSIAIGTQDNLEIEVIDAKLDQRLKDKQIEDMMNYLGVMIRLMPVIPAITQSVDILALLKQIARKMNLDFDELFPMSDDTEGKDAIDLELELVILGVVPESDLMSDPLKKIERYMQFMDSEVFKRAKPHVKTAMAQLISLTASNVTPYLAQKLAEKRKLQSGFNPLPVNVEAGVGNAGEVSGSGQRPSVPGVPESPISDGSQQTPTGEFSANGSPPGVAKRLGFGSPESA